VANCLIKAHRYAPQNSDVIGVTSLLQSVTKCKEAGVPGGPADEKAAHSVIAQYVLRQLAAGKGSSGASGSGSGGTAGAGGGGSSGSISRLPTSRASPNPKSNGACFT
jgi:hypothetical protein